MDTTNNDKKAYKNKYKKCQFKPNAKKHIKNLLKCRKM
jgi:lysozyme family protein